MFDPFCIAPENDFGLDDKFAKLFRLNGELEDEVQEVTNVAQAPNAKALYNVETVLQTLPLDRLSLLACSRQGIVPSELLTGNNNKNDTNGGNRRSRPPSSSALVTSATSSTAVLARVQEARIKANEERRLGKIRIVEAERKHILSVLRSVDPQAKTVNKEQNTLLMQLKAQDTLAAQQQEDRNEINAKEKRARGDDACQLLPIALPACNDPQDADLCDLLMSKQSGIEIQAKKLKKEVRRAEAKAQDEVEKLKQHQFKAAVQDVSMELKRFYADQRVRQKEEDLRLHLESLEESRHEKSVRLDAERRAKMKALTRSNLQRHQERQAEIEARALYREMRLQEREKEKEEMLEKRALLRAQEEERAAQRLRSLDERFSEYKSLQRQEYEAKMQLNDSRQAQLQLQSDALLELKNANDAQARHRVREVLRQQDDELTQKRIELEEKLESIEARREIVDMSFAERSQQLKDQFEERRQKLLQQRGVADDERQRRIAQLEAEYNQKEAHIQDMQRERELQIALRRELGKQKQEHHDENMRRVTLTEQYTRDIETTILEREREQERVLQEAKALQRKQITEVRESLQKEKEMMSRNLELLRRKGVSDSATSPSALTSPARSVTQRGTSSASSNSASRSALERRSSLDIQQQAMDIVRKKMEEFSSSQGSMRPASGNGSQAAKMRRSSGPDRDDADKVVAPDASQHKPSLSTMRQREAGYPQYGTAHASLHPSLFRKKAHDELAFVGRQWAAVDELDDAEPPRAAEADDLDTPMEKWRKGVDAGGPIEEMLQKMNRMYSMK